MLLQSNDHHDNNNLLVDIKIKIDTIIKYILKIKTYNTWMNIKKGSDYERYIRLFKETIRRYMAMERRTRTSLDSGWTYT